MGKLSQAAIQYQDSLTCSVTEELHALSLDKQSFGVLYWDYPQTNTHRM